MESLYPFPYSQAPQLDARIKKPRPPIHPSLAEIIDSFPLPETLELNFMRGIGQEDSENEFVYNADTVLRRNPGLKHAEYHIPRQDGTNVILSVFAPKAPDSASATLPLIFYMHGGGMVSGDRFGAVPEVMELLPGNDVVFATVEYALAPETKAPGASEDCYNALIWAARHVHEVGFDPAKIIIIGSSGGGALAAVISMMCRDKEELGAPLGGLMLLSPMLDDRCLSLSDTQFEFGSPWSTVANRQAWQHILGDRQGTEQVTAYEAPSRSTDQSPLPSTYIDVGECEIFRDAAVAFASEMWRGGSTCELHVWPGAFHLFDGMDNLEIPLIHDAVEAKRAWLRRALGSFHVKQV